MNSHHQQQKQNQQQKQINNENCTYCHRDLKNQINLNCSHVICFNCVQKLKNAENNELSQSKFIVQCPTCGKLTRTLDLYNILQGADQYSANSGNLNKVLSGMINEQSELEEPPDSFRYNRSQSSTTEMYSDQQLQKKLQNQNLNPQMISYNTINYNRAGRSNNSTHGNTLNHNELLNGGNGRENSFQNLEYQQLNNDQNESRQDSMYMIKNNSVVQTSNMRFSFEPAMSHQIKNQQNLKYSLVDKIDSRSSTSNHLQRQNQQIENADAGDGWEDQILQPFEMDELNPQQLNQYQIQRQMEENRHFYRSSSQKKIPQQQIILENQESQKNALIKYDWELNHQIKLLFNDLHLQQPLKCTEHGDFVSLYCNKERRLQCVCCIYQPNSGIGISGAGGTTSISNSQVYSTRLSAQSCVPAQSVSDKIISDNDNLKNEFGEKLNKIKNCLDRCRGNRSFLEETFINLNLKITNEFEEVINHIKLKEQIIREEVARHFFESMNTYQKYIVDLSNIDKESREFGKIPIPQNFESVLYSHQIFQLINETLKKIEVSVPIITSEDLNILDFQVQNDILTSLDKFLKLRSFPKPTITPHNIITNDKNMFHSMERKKTVDTFYSSAKQEMVPSNGGENSEKAVSHPFSQNNNLSNQNYYLKQDSNKPQKQEDINATSQSSTRIIQSTNFLNHAKENTISNLSNAPASINNLDRVSHTARSGSSTLRIPSQKKTEPFQ